MDSKITLTNEEWKSLWDLYSIGKSCLDTMATFVCNVNALLSDEATKNSHKKINLEGDSDLKVGKTGNRRRSLSFALTTHKKPVIDPEVHLISPILALLSNKIYNFFIARPTDFPSTEPNIVLGPSFVNQTTLSELKLDCQKFLANVSVRTSEFTPAQLILWEEIMDLVKQICEFTHKKADVIDCDGLENIIAATERIFSVAPRYIMQTSAMSPKKQLAITHAHIIEFMDRLVVSNARYDNQRAFDKGEELQKTMDQIWAVAKRRMLDQCSQMSRSTQESLRFEMMNDIIDKQSKSRMHNQVCFFNAGFCICFKFFGQTKFIYRKCQHGHRRKPE